MDMNVRGTGHRRFSTPGEGCPLAFFSLCVCRRGRKNGRSLSPLQLLVSSATVGRSQERILVLAMAGIGIATGNFLTVQR